MSALEPFKVMSKQELFSFQCRKLKLCFGITLKGSSALIYQAIINYDNIS